MKPFDQTYEVLSTIGKGGMGSVYLAKHKRLGTLWAIKEVNKSVGAQVDLLAEANILKRLNHPALPRIIDIFEDEAAIFIVEDYIEGIPLNKKLEEQNAFPESQVRIWAGELCEALEYLHRQVPNPIIYRDLKPSNIIIAPDEKLKIIDFGIAREYKKDSAHDTSYLGTRGYAAPEQYGTAQTDERTDIYSLGVVLYHVATGHSPNEPPYELLPIRQVDPALSEGLEFIIGKCTRNNPLERYQNTSELKHDLAHIDDFSAASREQRKRKRVRRLFAIALMLCGIAFAYIGFQMNRQAMLEAYQESFAAGTQAIQKGDMHTAKEILVAADNKAGISDGHYGLVVAYYNNEDYSNCNAMARQSLAFDAALGQNAFFNYCWGVALSEQGQNKEAIKRLAAADSLQPNTPIFMGRLARCYASEGNVTQAQAILAQLELLEDDGTAEYVSGSILEVTENNTAAIEQYRACIAQSRSQELSIAAYRAAILLYRNIRQQEPGVVDDEISTLLSMQRSFPNEDIAFVNEHLGEAYYVRALQNGNEQDYTSAVNAFQEVVGAGFGRASTYMNIAIIYQKLHDYDPAQQILSEALDLFPENAEIYIQMAFLLAEYQNSRPVAARDYSEVVRCYEQAMTYSGKGANMQRLEGLISDLKAGGWIR